jgi:hypothetical protein
MWSELKSFSQNTAAITSRKSADVYLYGAHVFTQALCHLGLDLNCIKGILDNDEKKQGKRLYGTRFSVMNPSVIRNSSNPVVVLQASHYQHEIKSQLVDINPLVQIIE